MLRFHRTGLPRADRAAAVALAAVTAAAALVSCTSHAGVRDGGPAPTLSPPVRASPLWPQYEPPVPPSAGEPSPTYRQYEAVPSVAVPADGLRAVSVPDLLDKDPNVPKLVRAALTDCPGAQCGLRKPVFRELTGDGLDELVVAFDEPNASLTLVQVYRASGGTVRPILITWGQLGITGETFGHDLVITSTGRDGRFTTRYRWNGTVMAAVAPHDEPAGPTAGPGAGSGHSAAPQTRTPR
ncbi:hypothetical protein [Streptomyces sp. NPDC018833]|uniref:hypothetical protein n=1 Tax=Streptomyces sp. NPDC018833 TaxID=3365053 RepID=UPI00378DA6F2